MQKDDGRTACVGRLMNPRSVVFVGASASPEKTSGQPVRNILAQGFEGTVYAVNRRGDPIDDIPTYRSLAEIPDKIDVGFVTVPAAACVDVVRQLGEKGASVAVVAVAGFAETGTEAGRRLSEELLRAGRESGVRIVGPVCNGLYSTPNALALGYNAIHRRRLRGGRIGLVSHSGALLGPFVTILEGCGAGLSRFVSSGSELDVSLAEFVAFLAEDEQTDVIALIIDHVGDGSAFRAAVRAARARGKQVIALKIGNSDLGRTATLAHSSNLAGARQVYDAVFEQEGVRTVNSVENLALAAAILSRRGRASGGVIACSTSGGGAIILADLLAESGVAVPSLAPATVAELSRHLRFEATTLINPFDLGLGGRDHYAANILALARDPSAAAMIVYGTPMSTPAKRSQLASAVIAAADDQSDLPIIYLSPARLFDDEREMFERHGIPVCSSTQDAVSVAKTLAPPVRAREEARAEAKAMNPGTTALSEFRSKQKLLKAGVPFPQERCVRSLDEAARAAAEIGYPVVVKASGRRIWHKSEAGLVVIGIDGPAALAEAWATLEERLAAAGLEADDGILVSGMVSDGIEAIVGVVRDHEFGPLMIFGPGGVLAEAFGASAMAHVPLPPDRAQLERALEATPLPRLATFRGRRHDIDGFLQFLEAVAAAAGALGDRIEELDINPVKILPDTSGVAALDALCVLRDATPSTSRETRGPAQRKG